MPRIAKTVIPRIRKSLRDRGVAMSLCRSFLLPIHLFKEYRAAKNLRRDGCRSEFDCLHGVETDGEFGGWTYLSDLDISSPNWIEGNNYAAIEPERFNAVLANLDIPFHEYTFVDFGSGKGRALLLASKFPFRRIIGLEFSLQLHHFAEENVRRYRSTTQKCTDIRCLNIDFIDFDLPREPLVLFFFDPCRVRVLEEVVSRIRKSLVADQRPLYIAYVAPRPEHEHLFASTGFLNEIFRGIELNAAIYQNFSHA